MPREIVVGTSDDVARGGADVPQEMPSLSLVAAHVHRVREALCGGGSASNGNGSSNSGGGLAAHVSIPASDLARVATLVDLLDQLRYWAVEEATTFVAQPSQLAETDAPEVIVACACSGRPQLMAQALTVMQQLLGHPQSASEVRRVLREVEHHHHTSGDRREEREEHSFADEPGDPVLRFLAKIMVAHARAAPLLVEAIGTATAAVRVVLRDIAEGSTEDVVADRVHAVFDVLCTTPLVCCTESAMRRFSESVTVQVAGVGFLAALVDLPALIEPQEVREGEEEAATTSMADMIAHSDGLLAVLLEAMHCHRHHLSLCRGVLHVWCAAGQSPACRPLLLRHGAYAASLRLLKEVGAFTMDVFTSAAEVIGYCVPLLDALQRRSLLLTLRSLLQRRPQLEMIELVLALLVAVLTAHGRRGGATRSAGGERDPYAMYARCPQPPERGAGEERKKSCESAAPSAPTASQDEQPQQQRPRRQVQLRWSSTYWQPAAPSEDAEDTWSFTLQRCAVPQLVSGVREYLSACDAVDDQDAADVQRVCTLADAVLSFF